MSHAAATMEKRFRACAVCLGCGVLLPPSLVRSSAIVMSLFMLNALSMAQQPAGKDAYHLFNPTPRELLRELAADRPDVTESPYTVDAGHVQVELSFVDYLRDGDLTSYSIAPVNFKVGLLNDVDLQLILEPYIYNRMPSEDVAGVFTTDSGFGDVQLRLKVNLWGNDAGQTAAAIMPFVKIPTASGELGNDHVEGGVIVPFATAIGDDWSLGLMAEFDAVYDDVREKYDMEFVHTAAIGRDLIGALAGYLEYIGIASTAPDSQYQVLLGVGVTYMLSADWMLDAGVNLGLAGGAADFNPFIGMTMRF